MICACIRGHDDDRVAKIRNRPLPICEASILKHLQEHMEDVGVRLLHLVKEDNGKRLFAYGICELTALFVADIARRRANKTRRRVLLHILGHIKADDCLLRSEHGFGKSTSKLRLTDSRRAEKEEGADRAAWIFNPCTRTAYRL